MGGLCFCNHCPSVGYCGHKPKVDLAPHPLQDWMDVLAKSNPNLLIRDLVAVSSHDATAYSISIRKCCSGAAVTQSLNFYEQLAAGARHLDCRYGAKGPDLSDIRQAHDIFMGADYFDELEHITRFLSDYPNEFLTIDMSRETYCLPWRQLDHIFNMVLNILGPYLITSADRSWFRWSTTTLGQVLSHPKKRIFLTVSNDILDRQNDDHPRMSREDQERLGFWDRNEYQDSKWWDVNCFKKVFCLNMEKLNNDARNPDQYRISQLITTPSRRWRDAYKYALGVKSIRVDQRQYLMHRNLDLHYYLRDQIGPHPALNFIMLDFIQWDPYGLHFLIGLNFAQKLTIHRAALANHNQTEAVDITNETRALIRKERSLWIPQFKRDFQKKNGVFVICYSFEGHLPRLEKHFFTENSQYLLNYHRGGLEKSLLLKAVTKTPLSEVVSIRNCLEFIQLKAEQLEKRISISAN